MRAVMVGKAWDLLGIADYDDIVCALAILEALKLPLETPVRYHIDGVPKGFDPETGEVGCGGLQTPPAEPASAASKAEKGIDLISPCTSDTFTCADGAE